MIQACYVASGMLRRGTAILLQQGKDTGRLKRRACCLQHNYDELNLLNTEAEEGCFSVPSNTSDQGTKK